MNVRELVKSLLAQETTTVASVGQGPAVALGEVPSTNPKKRRTCRKCKDLKSCSCGGAKLETWTPDGWVQDDEDEEAQERVEFAVITAVAARLAMSKPIDERTQEQLFHKLSQALDNLDQIHKKRGLR